MLLYKRQKNCDRLKTVIRSFSHIKVNSFLDISRISGITPYVLLRAFLRKKHAKLEKSPQGHVGIAVNFIVGIKEGRKRFPKIHMIITRFCFIFRKVVFGY